MKILFFLLLAITTLQAPSTAQDIHEHQNDFVRYAEKLREIWQARATFTGSMQENIERIQKIVFEDDEPCELADFDYGGFITYFGARFSAAFSNIFHGNIAYALDLLENLESPMKDESLQLVLGGILSRIARLGNHSELFQHQGSILPLTKSRGSINTGEFWFIGIDWPSFPVLYPNRLQIPQNYAALGLYDYAWRSYCEFANASIPEFPNENRVHMAINWQHAAENAYLAGETKLAWQLLMKAAVFGNEELFENVKKTVERWQAYEQLGKDFPRTETLQGDERRDAFNVIVETYQKMLAHPRAWALIEKYPEEFETPERLKRKIQEDWVRIATSHIPTNSYFAIQSITIYGYRIWPDGVDPLSITIPYAFSEGSVEKAKEDLWQGAILRRKVF